MKCENCEGSFGYNDIGAPRDHRLCQACAGPRTCDYHRLGLSDEGACLTGFTSRLAKAVAHLRDAWCNADAGNAAAIEHALAVLLEESHSARYQREVMETILAHDHYRGAELVRKIAAAGLRRAS